MAKEVRIDDAYLASVAQRLKQIRNEITMVKAGGSPGDTARRRGGHLNNLVVRAGSEVFRSGTDLTARIKTVGGQVDQRLSTADQKLSSYAQNLERIIRDTDSVEDANTSYAANTNPGTTNPGTTSPGNTDNG